MRSTAAPSMTLLAIVAWSLSLSVTTARADTQALQGLGTADYYGTIVDGTRGWTFSLAKPVTVTYLGLAEPHLNGIEKDHLISIWAIGGGDALASAVLPQTNTPWQERHWVDLTTPVTLPAGSYVIGAYAPGNAEAAWYFGSGATTAPGVTYGQSRFDSGNQMPTTYWSMFEQGFFGPNIRFRDPDPVPEPALIQLPVLLGLGGLGVWWRRRTRN